MKQSSRSVASWRALLLALVLALAGGDPDRARADVPPGGGSTPEPYPPPGYAADWQPPERTDFALDPTLPEDLEETLGPHHQGFHLRVSGGPTLSRMTAIGDPTAATSFSGFAAGLSVAAGAAVVDDVVVFGEIAATSALSPRIQSLQSGRYPEGTAVTTLGLGGGVAYYFMPTNINLSASVLLSQVRTVNRHRDQLLGSSEAGPALHLAAGKDWALTDSWALGLSLRAHLSQLDDTQDRHVAWRSYGLGLAVAAVYD